MKNRKLAFSLLLFAPMFALVACNQPVKHNITVLSSNENLGSVNTLSLKPYADGEKVNLSASVKPYTNSSFLCWIQNSSTIISTLPDTEITVSEETSGQYTAVFEESPLSGMMYAMVTKINFTSYDYTDVANVTYSIEYASLTSSETYRILSAGTYNQSLSNVVKNDKVIYLGKAGSLNTFKFRINISNVTYISSNITSEIGEFTFDTTISNSSFDENGNLILSSENSNGDSISLTIEKLKSSLID